MKRKAMELCRKEKYGDEQQSHGGERRGKAKQCLAKELPGNALKRNGTDRDSCEKL